VLWPHSICLTVICDCRFRAYVFFFQAEDGIRDRNVTGVQTCALPILICGCRSSSRVIQDSRLLVPVQPPVLVYLHLLQQAAQLRSEERRVGKECVYRGSQGYRKIDRRMMGGVLAVYKQGCEASWMLLR